MVLLSFQIVVVPFDSFYFIPYNCLFHIHFLMDKLIVPFWTPRRNWTYEKSDKYASKGLKPNSVFLSTVKNTNGIEFSKLRKSSCERVRRRNSYRQGESYCRLLLFHSDHSWFNSKTFLRSMISYSLHG